MKITILLNWILTAIWAVSALGLAIDQSQQNAAAEISRDKRQPRANPGGLDLFITPNKRLASLRSPYWVGFLPYSEKTPAQIQGMVKDSYDYTRQNFAARQVAGLAASRPRAQTTGSDLVATLVVPGKGIYTASIPRGPAQQYLKDEIQRGAQALFRARGGNARDGPLHVEDAVIYLFINHHPGFLQQHNNQFPAGTKIAIYGRYKIEDKSGDGNVVQKIDPCQKCRETLRNLDITSVSTLP